MSRKDRSIDNKLGMGRDNAESLEKIHGFSIACGGPFDLTIFNPYNWCFDVKSNSVWTMYRFFQARVHTT